MKSAIYIEEGKTQVVLHPENEFEKNVLEQINSNQVETTLKIGNFGACQGGWIRYYKNPYSYFGDKEPELDSLMILLTEKDKSK